MFSVRCTEFIPCPCCGSDLKVIGSRKRKVRMSTEQIKILIIRRLRCVNCNRIHHELPDFLVPYKRYESAGIEQVVSESESSNLPADNATLYRLRKWFYEMLPHFLGCLRAIAIRLGQDCVTSPSVPSLSVHQRIGLYVGNAPGWLKRIVRSVANSNLWIHTRSAFLSKTF